MTKTLTAAGSSWDTPADSVSDDWPAFQAAADNAGGKISVPAGQYKFSRPVIVKREYVKFHGDDSIVASWTPAGHSLFAFMPGNYPAFVPGEPLVSSPSMSFDGSLAHAVNLRDSYRGDIDGMSQFCFECFVQFDSFVGGLRNIASSWGTRLSNDPAFSAFLLGVFTDGGKSVLWAWLRTGDLRRVIQLPTPLAVGTVYHVAVTYDGSSVRLFVNGALAGSIEATGTVNQSLYEDFTVGANYNRWPLGSASQPAITGRVSGVKLSYVARYVANFTPVEPVYDVGTLLFLDLATTYGPYISFQSPEGRGWLLHRDDVTLDSIGHNELVGFRLYSNHGTALFVNNTQSSYFGGLAIGGRRGIELWKNCYRNTIERVIVTDGFVGIALLSNSPLCRVIDCQHVTEGVGFVASDSSVVFENCWAYGGTMKAAYLLKGDATYMALIGCATGDEGQEHVPEAGIIAGDLECLLVQSGGVTFYGHPAPLVILRNCKATLFQGVQFGVNPGVPVIVQQSVPGTIEFQGCSQNGLGAPRPWKDD